MSEAETSTDTYPSPGSKPARSGWVRPALIAAGVLSGLGLVLGALVFAILPVVPWWLGALVGLVVPAVLVYRRVENAHDLVVEELLNRGFGLVGPTQRLLNTSESLALSAGIGEPSVSTLGDPGLNALAVRRGADSSIIVTQGLAEVLELVELEGVVAEMVARLKNGTAETVTVITALFEIWGGPAGALLRPLRKFAVSELVGELGDLEADRQAVGLTRYPPGLLAAFQRIKEADVASQAAHVMGPLWMVGQGSDSVEGERASIELRIDVLGEL